MEQLQKEVKQRKEDKSLSVLMQQEHNKLMFAKEPPFPYLPLLHPNQIDGCIYHRILQPFKYLPSELGIERKGTFVDYLKDAKIITWNRAPHLPPEVLNRVILNGTRLVADLDDYWVLYPEHNIYEWWTERKIGELYVDICHNSDAVTVTTERLAQKMREINPNTFVLPNGVPFDNKDQWSFPKEKQANGLGKRILLKNGNTRIQSTVRFGYVAGSSHLPDLHTIKDVFQEHLYDFSLCGFNNPQAGKTLTVWEFMEDIASGKRINGKNVIQNPRYHRVGTKDIHNYMSHYDDLDVAIAPLLNNNFNHHKSSLKAYEAGLKKCAFICSGIPPYTDDLPEGVVTFCNSTQEWKEAFKKHSDPGYAREQGEKLHEWVFNNRNLVTLGKERQQVYDYISTLDRNYNLAAVIEEYYQSQQVK